MPWTRTTRETASASLLVALLALGCGGESNSSGSTPEPEWEASLVREQYPEETEGAACLTVWVVSGDGCAVSDATGAVLKCVAGPEPLLLNAVPDPFGTCIVGIRDCQAGLCQDPR